MIYLIINSSIYLAFYIHAVLKKGYKNEIALLPLIWFVSSVFTIFYFNSPVVYNDVSSDLTLEPFLWLAGLFLMFYIFLYKNNSDKCVNITVGSDKIFNLIVTVIVICAIPPFIENLIHLARGGVDLNAMLSVKDDGLKISGQEHLTWISARLENISGIAFLAIPIFIFYLLSQGDKKKGIVIGLGLTFLNGLMHNVIIGARNTLIQSTIYLLYCYLFFHGRLNASVKKFVMKVAMVFGGLVFLYIVYISIFRFQDTKGGVTALDVFYLYAGESFYNFNCDAWWTNYHYGGEKTFENLIAIFDPSYKGVTKSMDIRTWALYTCFADALMDYGKIVPYVIAFLLLTVINVFFKYKKTTNIGTLIIVFSVAFYIINGFLYNPYTNLWRGLIASIIIALILYIKPDKKRL